MGSRIVVRCKQGVVGIGALERVQVVTVEWCLMVWEWRVAPAALVRT